MQYLQLQIKASDEVFQLLEENQMQVSSMKASRFCSPFRYDVDFWEKALDQIVEATELLLKVQTQWLYLENIFLGEDIRMQVLAWMHGNLFSIFSLFLSQPSSLQTALFWKILLSSVFFYLCCYNSLLCSISLTASF